MTDHYNWRYNQHAFRDPAEDTAADWVQRELERLRQESKLDIPATDLISEHKEFSSEESRIHDRRARLRSKPAAERRAGGRQAYMGTEIVSKEHRRRAERDQVMAARRKANPVGHPHAPGYEHCANSNTMEASMASLKDRIEVSWGAEKADCERRLAVIRQVYQSAFQCSPNI